MTNGRYIIDSYGLNLLRQLLNAEKVQYDGGPESSHTEVERLKAEMVKWYKEQRRCTNAQAERGVILLVDLFFHIKD